MAKFFKTNADLRLYLGVSKSYSIEGFETKEAYAISQYMVDWIGDDQLNALSAAYLSDTMTAQQTALLPKIQMPLANFGFYEHIPFLEVLIDDAGINRHENDQYKSAYSGQIENLKASVLAAAYNSLEKCLEFLEAHEADYPLWMDSDAYTFHKSNFINSASMFNMCYPIDMSVLVFKNMRSFMNDAEAFEIQPHIGHAFFAELKAAILAKSPTPEQQYVIAIIQKSVANFTVGLATANGWANFSSDGIIQREYANADTGPRTKSAEQAAVGLKITEAEAAGRRWRGKLISHLKNNLTDYPTFAADITVNPVVDETTAECPPLKNIFSVL